MVQYMLLSFRYAKDYRFNRIGALTMVQSMLLSFGGFRSTTAAGSKQSRTAVRGLGRNLALAVVSSTTSGD